MQILSILRETLLATVVVVQSLLAVQKPESNPILSCLGSKFANSTNLLRAAIVFRLHNHSKSSPPPPAPVA